MSMTPITPIPTSRDEWIAERAGIIEFEAGKDRATAERIAEQLWPAWEAAHA